MKKTLFLLLITSLVLAVSSCKRADVADPDWDSPAGFYVLLEGSASPAVLLIDGNIHTSKIFVRASDSKGNPLPGKTIYLAQFDSASHEQVSWGYFENSASTIQKVTNANGEISATFYWPVEWLSSSMYIHALMVTDGHSYSDTLPQDYISLTLIRSESNSNKGPAVSIMVPADNAVVSGTAAISAVAMDAADGIKKVECYIDGQLIGYQAGSATSDSYSFNWDTSQYSNSRHTIDVVAIDNAGMSGSDSVKVDVNNTGSDSPPTAEIIYPSDGANIILPAGNAITVQANATDDKGINHVSFYVNGSLVQQNMSKSGTLYQYNWMPPVDGDYTIYVIAFDTINQATKSTEVKVTVNVNQGTGPVVNITAPAPNATVGGTVAISALATADSGINKVECYIDNQLIDSKPGSTTSDSYSFSWNATQYSNGVHTIKVTAYDKKGVSNSVSINVTLNNSDAAPVAAIIYPTDKLVILTSLDLPITNIIIKANATDDKGISHVSFYVNDILQIQNMDNPSGILYECTWSAPIGTYTMYIIAYDTINQATKSDTVTVTIKYCEVKIDISAPKNGVTVSGTVLISAQAFADRGIEKVDYYIDGTFKGTLPAIPSNTYEFNWDSSLYTNGPHTIMVTAVDTKGLSESDTITVTVAN